MPKHPGLPDSRGRGVQAVSPTTTGPQPEGQNSCKTPWFPGHAPQPDPERSRHLASPTHHAGRPPRASRKSTCQAGPFPKTSRCRGATDPTCRLRSSRSIEASQAAPAGQDTGRAGKVQKPRPLRLETRIIPYALLGRPGCQRAMPSGDEPAIGPQRSPPPRTSRSTDENAPPTRSAGPAGASVPFHSHTATHPGPLRPPTGNVRRQGRSYREAASRQHPAGNCSPTRRFAALFRTPHSTTIASLLFARFDTRARERLDMLREGVGSRAFFPPNVPPRLARLPRKPDRRRARHELQGRGLTAARRHGPFHREDRAGPSKMAATRTKCYADPSRC